MALGRAYQRRQGVFGVRSPNTANPWQAANQLDPVNPAQMQQLRGLVPNAIRAGAGAVGRGIGGLSNFFAGAPNLAAQGMATAVRRNQGGGNAGHQGGGGNPAFFGGGGNWGQQQGRGNTFNVSQIDPMQWAQAANYMNRGTIGHGVQNFAGQMQGAMGQIGSVLQGNANRITQGRQQDNQMRLVAYLNDEANKQRMAELQSRERMFGSMVDMFGGQGGGAGGIGTVQQPGMSDAGEIQQQAAGSLYDNALAQLAPGAFYQGGIGGFNFASPSGGASATVPGTPWGGGAAGGGSLGIDASPGKIWNPALAAQAQARLGSLVNRTAPYLKGVSAAGKRGMAGQFADLMRGAVSRTYRGLERGGTQAEAKHGLDSQIAQARTQQSLWDLLSRVYRTNLGGTGGDIQRQVQMLQALA